MFEAGMKFKSNINIIFSKNCTIVPLFPIYKTFKSMTVQHIHLLCDLGLKHDMGFWSYG